MHFSVWPGCFDACQKPFDVTLRCDKTLVLILLSVDSFKGQGISNQTHNAERFSQMLSLSKIFKRVVMRFQLAFFPARQSSPVHVISMKNCSWVRVF